MLSISLTVFPALGTQLDREDALLLAAIDPRLTVEQHADLARLFTLSVDWTCLVAQADRHDVTPLLYLRLQQFPSGTVPQEVHIRLARRTYACLAWNLYLHRVLRRLLMLFNQAQVPVMPLKGLLLAELLYGDCTLRPTNDLDLLVRDEDLEQAVRLLLAAGCRRHFSPEQESGLYHYLFSFSSGDGTDVLVELHRDFTSRHLARLDVQKVWATASPQIWEECVVWSLKIDDLFLYLCTHATRDGLGSIKHLLDIVLLIERFQASWCWTDLAKTVLDTRIQTPVWLSLRQCQKLFPVTIPREFLDAIRPARRLGFIMGHALFTWRGGTLHSPLASLRSPMGTILAFLWEDSWRGRIRHLRRMLLPTAGLRARRTGLPTVTSAIRGYPRWLWCACCQLAEQIGTLRRVRRARKSDAP
jgi:hypothetical protein